jgi:hypothetical protein
MDSLNIIEEHGFGVLPEVLLPHETRRLIQVHVCARFCAVRGRIRSRGLEGALGSSESRAEVTDVGIIKAPRGPSLVRLHRIALAHWASAPPVAT